MSRRLKFCGLLLVLVSPGVQATTYTVTSSADGGGICPDAANCTLRDAITAASSGSDIIVFNGDLTISLASTLTLTNSVTIDATGHNVVVDGNQSGEEFHVDTGVTAQITYLTMQNGLNASGGGIDNEGTLTLTNCTVSGNTAEVVNGVGGEDAFGGGIYNSGTLTLINSTLSGNIAYGNNGSRGSAGQPGSGVAATGGTGGNGGNGGNGFGGGIYNSGTLTLIDSTLSGNSANAGSGGMGGKGGNGGPGNPPGFGGTGGNGGNGGIAAGGGIYNSGTLTLINSTLSENDVAQPVVPSGGSGGSGGNGGFGGTGGNGGNGGSEVGGGIYNSGMSTLTNDTLSGNGFGFNAPPPAGQAGGGGLTFPPGPSGSSGSPGNPGPSNVGGGVATTGGTITFTNTIVADGCAGTQTDGGGNIDTGSSCAFGGGSQSNVSNLNLGPLQNNGGPTQTMLPGAGSAAINSTVCTNAPLADQLNDLRPDPSSVGQATPCDAGAVEVGSVSSDRIFADGFGSPPVYR